jgi:alkylation response protein AidB-like acyl-CoA dehydrogenase
MSAQVVDIAYNLCGAGAIFHSNPIHRRFQDIHVITQHVQGHQVHYETAGQHFVGLDPQGVF